MTGEPITAVQSGLDLLVATLRQDPQALETAHLSVITFNETATQVVPLTELASFQPPTLHASSTTSLGEALRVTKQCIEREVLQNSGEVKGDWKPLVFLMTDGLPTDDWQSGLAEFKSIKTGLVVACAAGPDADANLLKQITENVVTLAQADASSIGQYFKWLSQSIAQTSQRVDLVKTDNSAPSLSELPPPPPVINLV
jgi:uncharacterized protein YegL